MNQQQIMITYTSTQRFACRLENPAGSRQHLIEGPLSFMSVISPTSFPGYLPRAGDPFGSSSGQFFLYSHWPLLSHIGFVLPWSFLRVKIQLPCSHLNTQSNTFQLCMLGLSERIVLDKKQKPVLISWFWGSGSFFLGNLSTVLQCFLGIFQMPSGLSLKGQHLIISLCNQYIVHIRTCLVSIL